MPGLRYGADFTDDAERVRKELQRLKGLQRSKRGGLNSRERERLDRLRKYIRRSYGSEKLLNEFAGYSRVRQGTLGRRQSLPLEQIKGYRRPRLGKFQGRRVSVAPRPAIPQSLLDRRAAASRIDIGELERAAIPGVRGRIAAKGRRPSTPKKAKKAKKAAKKAPAKKAKKAAKKAPAKRAAR